MSGWNRDQNQRRTGTGSWDCHRSHTKRDGNREYRSRDHDSYRDGSYCRQTDRNSHNHDNHGRHDAGSSSSWKINEGTPFRAQNQISKRHCGNSGSWNQIGDRAPRKGSTFDLNNHEMVSVNDRIPKKIGNATSSNASSILGGVLDWSMVTPGEPKEKTNPFSKNNVHQELPQISKSTWDLYSLAQKVASQHPDLEGAKGLEYLSPPYPIDEIEKNSRKDIATMTQAAQHAYTLTVKSMKDRAASIVVGVEDELDSDLDDDDDNFSAPYGHQAQNMTYSPETLQKFCSALPYNVIFLTGFDVFGIHHDDEINCYCPCSKKMEKWRQQFGIEGIMEGNDLCTNTSKMEPTALMAHLEIIGDGKAYLHIAVKHYIRRLYENYLEGHGHKALYKKGDKDYKRAEALERKLNIRARRKLEVELANEKMLRKQLEEEDRKRTNEMEELKLVNSDLYDKIKKLKDNKEALGIVEKEALAMTDNDIRLYRSFLCALVKNLKSAFRAEHEDQTIAIRVPQNFLLQSLFDELYSNESKDATFLFKSLDHLGSRKKNGFHAWKLFQDWNVKYDVVSKHEEEKAIDQGGPTREFLSQVFLQMEYLYVSVDVDDKEKRMHVGFGSVVFVDGVVKGQIVVADEDGFNVACDNGCTIENVSRNRLQVAEVCAKLFERTAVGLIPSTDEMLEHKGGKFADKLIKKAKRYYCAIGRVMLHCIISDHPISSTALPNFYRNVIFRSCHPENDDYDKVDLMLHLAEIELSESVREHYLGKKVDDIFGDGNLETITYETFFKYVIPKRYVEFRSIAITHMREGLTLNGIVNFSDFFSTIPLDAVSKIAFSSPWITPDDVIAILKESEENDKTFKVDESLKEEQRQFIEKTLPSVLRNKYERELADDENLVSSSRNTGSSFLSQFVSFCTGLSYLPHRQGNQDYSIIVEFDFAVSTHESLPVAHTCSNILKVPGWVYGNDAELFEAKLDKALELCKGVFGMN